MSVISNNTLAGSSGQAAGGGGYEIERSLRFNSDDSAYLNRTPSSAGNRKTWTWSGWVKRSKFANQEFMLFGTPTSSNSFQVYFASSTYGPQDTLKIGSDTGGVYRVSDAVFRDPSAWLHLVIVANTPDATDSNRLRAWVNGVELTWSSSASITQSSDLGWNSTSQHVIGARGNPNLYYDGYLADVHFIDGQALAPTDFGEYDDNNVWQPKEYSGSYGTNGFHLDFSDGADLGNDSSGANNDWTPNNLVGQLQTGDLGMDVVTYTGNGGTQTISGLEFQPDLVWIKSRSAGYSHRLYDSIRGVSDALYPDITDSEGVNQGTNENLTGFTSDGFSLGAATGIDAINANNATFVAWAWKAGGAAVSNTDGTITSQVSANQTHGFSIVSWTGTGAAGSIGHSLNAQPAFIIVKNRDQSVSSWDTYHSAIGNTGALRLNSTSGTITASDFWNNTSPTSTVFTVSTSGSNNASGQGMIAYCWSEVAGYSKFGSYTGNGSSTGPVVTTGFEPRYLLIKRTDTTGNWIIYDSARDTTNPRENRIVANSSNAEVTSAAAGFNFLLDGFQAADSNVDINASSGTYIYMAFAAGGDGADLDSLLDTPEQRSLQTDSGSGGDVVGNYATLNPLDRRSTVVLSNGNLDVTTSTAYWSGVKGTIGVTSGKYFFEATSTGPFANKIFFGICASSVVIDPSSNVQDDLTERAKGMLIFCDDGKYQLDDNSRTSYSTSLASGDVIAVALDLDGSTVQFYKNGTALGVIDISGSPLASTTVVPFFVSFYTDTIGYFNFGQRAFAYAAPSGYKALCTANLPDPTIADGSQYFDTKLYTGNGSTQTISGLGFSPDFVWIKARTDSVAHYLGDTVRGLNYALKSNTTDVEDDDHVNGYISAATSDGFTVTAGANNSFYTNGSADQYAGWAWDAGSSTVTNTDGSISAQVRANPSAGFSIVSYTGTGSSATVGHGLNAAPQMIIIKTRNTARNWTVGHQGIASDPWTDYLTLNSDAAAGDSNTVWNDTAPTSSVFTVGTANGVNVNLETHIAYCFAPVEGYSAMGSYVGNGSTDGPFVFTRFRPAFVLIKASSAGGNWQIIDSTRSDFNLANDKLWPSQSYAENSATLGGESADNIDILSNGFKLKTSNAGTNGSGVTYIYYAVAEHPFKTSRAR